MALYVEFFALGEGLLQKRMRKKKPVWQIKAGRTNKMPVFSPVMGRKDGHSYYLNDSFYPKNEINTPAATAEPITPEILLAMQY